MGQVLSYVHKFMKNEVIAYKNKKNVLVAIYNVKEGYVKFYKKEYNEGDKEINELIELQQFTEMEGINVEDDGNEECPWHIKGTMEYRMQKLYDQTGYKKDQICFLHERFKCNVCI